MLKFELPEQMVAAMARVLGNGPYNIVAPILEELQKQINAQAPSARPTNGAAVEQVTAQ